MTRVLVAAATCLWLFALPVPAQSPDTLKTRAEAAFSAAQYEAARDLQRDLVSALRNAGDKVAQAAALLSLAETQRVLGTHEQAEDSLRAALALYEDTQGPDSAGVADTLNVLGFVLYETGRASEAEPVLRRALAVHEAVTGPDSLPYADALSNLGTVLDWLGRGAEAEQHHRRSVEISTRITGRVSQSTSRSLNNLALSLDAQGRLDEAEAVYREALALDRKLFGDRHEDTAIALMNLADLVAGKTTFGATFEAISLYEEAIAIRVAILGEDHPDTARARSDLGQVYLRFNDFEKSAALFGQAIRIYTLPENRAEANRFNSVFSVSAALHLHTRPDDPATAFETVQWPMSSAAVQAMAATTERLAAGSGELPALLRRGQDLAEEARRLQSDILTASAAGKGDTARQLRARLASVRADSEETESRIRTGFPAYASIDPARPWSAQEVSALLRPGEALILITGGQTRTSGDMVNGSIFAVRPDGQVAGALLEAGWGLWADSTRLICGLSLTPGPDCVTAAEVAGAPGFRGTFSMSDGDDGFGPPPFDLDLAHSLYSRTLGRIEPALEGVNHLIVVLTEEEFSPLPLGLLVRRPAPPGNATARLRAANWLVRDYAVTVLPSVSALGAIRNGTPTAVLRAGSRFLGVGDPVIGQAAAVDCNTELAPLMARLDADRTRMPFRMAGGTTADLFTTTEGAALARPERVRALARLPDTRCELERIRESLGGGDLLLDGQATEAALKGLNDSGALAGYDILSFATHGLVAGEAGATEPALVLTPPDTPSRRDDGLLTATEIAGLRLHADWVLLSACNTAAGSGSGGESLSGLARSFFFAGARSVLVSHWPVHSEAAVRITTGAFAQLADTPQIGKAEALRRSVLAIINDPDATPSQLHPRYWAPFSLVGEGG